MSKPPLFDRTRRWLRKEYPLGYPVTIRVVKDERIPKMWGCFELDAEPMRGLILIRSSLSQAHASETLIEEWAHALRETLKIPVPYDGEPHDSHFWLIYGEIVTKWRDRFAT